MTQNRYHHILRLSTTHPYYRDQAASVLSIAPTVDTAAEFKRAGLVARQTPDGLDIFVGDQGFDDGELTLRSLFEIVLPPDFYKVTDPDWCGDLEADALLFLTDFQRSADGSTLRINSTSGTALPIRSHGFRHPLEAALHPAPPQILNWQDHALVWQGVVPEPGARSLDVSASDVPDGRYLLSQRGKTLLDFFLTSSPRKNCVLELNLKMLLAQTDQALVTVSPSFEARLYHWRYVLHTDRSDLDLSAATITAEPGGPTFTGPFKETNNGVTNWVFTSDEPIALIEPSGTRYNIRCNLPRPAPSIPCPEANVTSVKLRPDGKAFVATMWLYP